MFLVWFGGPGFGGSEGASIICNSGREKKNFMAGGGVDGSENKKK